MIPHVTVTDRETAQEYLQDPHHTIGALMSIHCYNVDPVPGFEEFPRLKIALRFDDVLDTRHGYVPADTNDALKIVAFARAVPNKTSVLIHCAAGISRSTACAMAIPAVRLAPNKANAQAICNWIVDVRPCAQPNPHVLSLIDHTAGWGGVLVGEALRRFKR